MGCDSYELIPGIERLLAIILCFLPVHRFVEAGPRRRLHRRRVGIDPDRAEALRAEDQEDATP